MKQFLMAICLIISLPSFAQITALTERGDTIYVYDNGTWSFDEKDEDEMASGELSFLDMELELDTINTKFTTSLKSTKEAVSQLGFYKVKYDPIVWKREPPASYNEDAEFAFKAKDKDIYCVVIAEEIEIGTENIVKIALNMMRENTGADVKIIKTELRNVNGKELVHGIYEVNLNGLTLIFDAYYYSDASGTVQFTTWTGTNLHKKHTDTIESLLNGLIITK